MAKFLQETIRESGIKSPDKIKQSEEFKEFFRKVSCRELRLIIVKMRVDAYSPFSTLGS
jgi:hypothetical protein